MEITVYPKGKVIVGVNRLPGDLTREDAFALAESMVREREDAESWRLVTERGATQIALGVNRTPYWFVSLEYLDLGQPKTVRSMDDEALEGWWGVSGTVEAELMRRAEIRLNRRADVMYGTNRYGFTLDGIDGPHDASWYEPRQTVEEFEQEMGV